MAINKDTLMGVERIFEEKIEKLLRFRVICSLDEDEGMIIVRVFNVSEQEKHDVKKNIRQLERAMYPNTEYFTSIILYTAEETEKYFKN